MKNIFTNWKYVNKIIFLIILFLVFMFFCIYKLNNIKTLKEFFQSVKYNCNSCSAKPYSGNCKPIYDLSFTIIGVPEKIDISLIDTSLVFCEWESIGNSCMLDENDDLSTNKHTRVYKNYLCCNRSIYTNNLNTP